MTEQKSITLDECTLEPYFAKVKTHYPVGTVYYKFCVTDSKSRYLSIPWLKNPGWIETDPLCIDIYAKEDELEERLNYFKNIDSISIGKVEQYCQKPAEEKFTFRMSGDVLTLALTKLIEGYEQVAVPCKIDLPNGITELPMVANGDGICDLENVETVQVYELFFEELRSLTPDFLTEEDPLWLFKTPSSILLKIKDDTKPIKFKYLFIPNAVRIKNIDH